MCYGDNIGAANGIGQETAKRFASYGYVLYDICAVGTTFLQFQLVIST